MTHRQLNSSWMSLLKKHNCIYMATTRYSIWTRNST